MILLPKGTEYALYIVQFYSKLCIFLQDSISHNYEHNESTAATLYRLRLVRTTILKQVDNKMGDQRGL